MNAPPSASGPGRPLFETTTAAPSTPLLLTSSGAALVLGGAGEVELLREARGGSVEFGGVYSESLRVSARWTIEGEVEGVAYPLPRTMTRLRAARECVTSEHRWGPVVARQELFALPSGPGAGRRLRFTADRPVELTVRETIEPFLVPVLVEGVRPYEFEAERLGPAVRVRRGAYELRAEATGLPLRWTWDGAPWDGAAHRGELRQLSAVRTYSLRPGVPVGSDHVLLGGLRAKLEAGGSITSAALGGSAGWAAESSARWAEWRARTPSLELPDAPLLEKAYGLARDALRSLYVGSEDQFTGLVAGYPWYATLWCRDLAWMLPAVLWMGDFDRADASLRTVFRFQATSHIPLLGAEPGELPMQVSAGPVFLFGTSDTTLYYPGLVRGLTRHSGSMAPAEALWPHLELIEAWARTKTDPSTRLFRHGGEADEIRQATARVGAVHFGFDAVDTTIWDSTDRRDHAIDLQVLRWESLGARAELAERLGHPAAAVQARAEADALRRSVRDRYPWAGEGYLYDSTGRDPTIGEKVRPNALRAVSSGLLDPPMARSVVARAARADLTTPWGVRTLSSDHATFDPMAYHDGQVWTIATAWLADAAFAVGDVDEGIRQLGTIASRLVEENGLANECYRGDRAEAFDSCFLLGFSVGPFLTVLFERLWGLSVRADLGELTVRPAFPAHWRSADLQRLRVGNGSVDLAFRSGALTVSWSGPGPLRVVLPGTTGSLDPGASQTFALPRS